MKKIWLIPLIVFAILMGNITHEMVHYYDSYRANVEVEEICFFGYLPEKESNFLRGSNGWVKMRGKVGSGELIPTVLGLLVTFSILLIFLWLAC